MQINKRSTDELGLVVAFLIEPEDYEGLLKGKMKEKQKKSSFKGFRIGKVPENMIKKMYGNALLAETVNEVLGKAMEDFFNEEKIEYLGEPILAEGNEPVDLDINDTKAYSFTFELGLKPVFEVGGLSEVENYTVKSIIVDEKIIDEEFEVTRRRAGKQETVEDDIQEKDILSLKARELEGDSLKYEGWESTFSIMVESIADESLKKEVLGKMKGDIIKFDIFNLEKDRDEKFVKKHFLYLDENEDKEIGNYFEAEIREVKRLIPAELDEEFFEFQFGEEVKDEEGARDFIRKELHQFYEKEAAQFLNMNIMETVLQKTDVRLPEMFLKRWLLQMDQNKEMDPEVFEKQFSTFVNEMKWTLIRNQLSEKYEIGVENEEIDRQLRMRAYTYIQSQMGYVDPEMFQQIYQALLKDKSQYQKAVDEVLSEKIFDKLREMLSPAIEEVSIETFREQVKALNERIKAQKQG